MKKGSTRSHEAEPEFFTIQLDHRFGPRRLMTHPGVGPLTALAFVLIIGEAERFRCGKQEFT
jgi:transposase